MPRLLPDPTGYPSKRAVDLIAAIDEFTASDRSGDSEEWLIGMRDLHHIFTAAMRGWEQTAARAQDDPNGPSLQDMADVSGLKRPAMQGRVELGRDLLPDGEREAVTGRVQERRRRLREDGPRKRVTALDRLLDELDTAGRSPFLVRERTATGRRGWQVISGGEHPARMGVWELGTVDRAVERGLVELGAPTAAPRRVATLLGDEDTVVPVRRLDGT